MDTVQQIKDKLTILDVVSPYVKLVKSGRTYKGLSPFNKEKTPSFYVNVERGTYYCFSSGQGGDHFEFVQKMEGVDFKGALKILAEKAGVEIKYEGGKVKEEKSKLERMYETMAAAERFFARSLDEQGAAYQYALSRGLTAETIKAWNLGFAPEAWRSLLETLTAEGFTIPELVAAGLVKEADEKRGTFYDRFRNRLMFPIRDSVGRVVAFTGRALAKDDLAKYLNSPETDLYKKSKVLFGMDRAKDAIRTRGFALLVEGQFDLVLLHQIGFTNTIALSGTALSTDHLNLVKRYAENLMLALDADRAGLAASAKNAHAALTAGMRVKAVRMPAGKDPADLASSDPKDFTDRVKEANDIINFFLVVLAEGEKNPQKLEVEVERIVLRLVKVIQRQSEQARYVEMVSRALGTTQDAVRQMLSRIPRDIDEKLRVASAIPSLQQISTPVTLRRTSVLAALHAYPGTALAKRLESEYARIIGAVGDETPSERSIFEASNLYGEQPEENACDDLLRSLEAAVIDEQLKNAVSRLQLAEAAKDATEVDTAMKLYEELRRRKAAL